MEYNDLFNTYYNQFLHEFGERKIRKIDKIINDSKHTRSLLNQCYIGKFAPTSKDLRQCVLSNIKLSFSKKPTELFAMTLLLKKFNDEVNVDNCIISELEVMQIFGKFNNTFKY